MYQYEWQYTNKQMIIYDEFVVLELMNKLINENIN